MEAFEALYSQYGGLVLRTAYLITGDREEANDVFQEVFISIWKSRQTFDPRRGAFATWLHRITVNQCAQKQRKKKPAHFSLEQNNLDLPDSQYHSSAEEAVVSKWEYDRLVKALNSMDSKHRSVLALRYFNDLSYDEIAKVLNIPLGTVKSRIHQALLSLREQVGLQQG